MSFSNAHNFSIGTFNAYSNSSPDPLKILQASRATEATHTSKTASYAPRCKPGSRAEVIRDIMSCVGSTNGHQTPTSPSIIWFSGPAGGGKTCIMREVAALCQKGKRLAASYFFSSRVAGLDNEQPFVATLVHQFLSSIPAIKDLVLQRISQCEELFSDALDAQLEMLVVDPLATISRTGDDGIPNVVVVDGFDECRDLRERDHILRLLYILATLHYPFIIVLASRPELDIRTAFGSRQFRAITRTIELHAYDGDSDIRHYICDECEAIRETHPMKRLIPAAWPSEQSVDALVTKASGNYIFPSTVIKYVANPRRNPMTLLSEVMGLSISTTGANPLAELDALYAHILHPPQTDIALMKRLLHCLLKLNDTDRATAEPFTYTTSYLDDVFSLEAGTTDMTFCDLHSVLNIKPLAKFPEENSVGFHHKSLQDFLRTKERSYDLYQPDVDTYIDLLTGHNRHLQRWTRELTSGDGLVANTVRLTSGTDFWTNLRPSADLANAYSQWLKSAILLGGSKALPPSVVNWKSGLWRTWSTGRADDNIELTRDTIHADLCQTSSHGPSCVGVCQSLTAIVEVIRSPSLDPPTQLQSSSEEHELPVRRTNHLPAGERNNDLNALIRVRDPDMSSTDTQIGSQRVLRRWYSCTRL